MNRRSFWSLLVVVFAVSLSSSAQADISISEIPYDADLNQDGYVDASDLMLFLQAWHTGQKRTPTPTPTPGPEEIVINIPGLPTEAKPLTLVRVPSGSFQMGSPDDDRSRLLDEGPVHTVTIGYDFFVGKWEVTQAQWTALMGSNPALESEYGVGDNYPVHYVSWNDLREQDGFIETLNALGQGTFRLPSEAEWEYACRAGTSTRFYFGDSLDCPDEDQNDCATGGLPGNRSDYMWFYYNDSSPTYGTKPVGMKLPNQFGLYDMSGNVWEWCEDDSHNNYTDAPTDGSAWVDFEREGYRMLRGGAWDYDAASCRSPQRYSGDPLDGGSSRGFRVVMTAD